MGLYGDYYLPDTYGPDFDGVGAVRVHAARDQVPFFVAGDSQVAYLSKPSGVKNSLLSHLGRFNPHGASIAVPGDETWHVHRRIDTDLTGTLSTRYPDGSVFRGRNPNKSSIRALIFVGWNDLHGASRDHPAQEAYWDNLHTALSAHGITDVYVGSVLPTFCVAQVPSFPRHQLSGQRDPPPELEHGCARLLRCAGVGVELDRLGPCRWAH